MLGRSERHFRRDSKDAGTAGDLLSVDGTAFGLDAIDVTAFDFA